MSIVAIAPVYGDAGDIFAVSAPAIGSAAPKAADIADGDASVSTQTGALTYSYPVAVAPGRNGMQPAISLSYSSQAPIYGGIAAGWSLSGLHIITRDTSNGLIAEARYQSSMAGNRPLVQVTDPIVGDGVLASFRAKNDASWTRYELLGDHPTSAKWRALTTDGRIWYFGESGHGTCPAFTPTYAPLTRMVDKFGKACEVIEPVEDALDGLADWVGDLIGVGTQARKSDIKDIDAIVNAIGLNKKQRRLLHDEITGQELTLDEIRAIAEEFARNSPKKGRGDD